MRPQRVGFSAFVVINRVKVLAQVCYTPPPNFPHTHPPPPPSGTVSSTGPLLCHLAIVHINGVATLTQFSYKKFKYVGLTGTKESGNIDDVAAMRGFHCTHVGSQQIFPSWLPTFFPDGHLGILWTPTF